MNTQALGFHGIRNAKYCKRGETAGTVTIIPYVKNIALNALFESVDQYANDKLILQIPRDRGYDGELGVTAPDPVLDKALGYQLDGAAGNIKVGAVKQGRFDLYYEMTMEQSGGAKLRKVWLYNVQLGKGAENTATDAESIEFGTYTYPIRVFGTPLMAAEGDAEYVDSDGMGRTAYMIYADPDDAGYDTFGDTVPAAKIKAQVGA